MSTKTKLPTVALCREAVRLMAERATVGGEIEGPLKNSYVEFSCTDSDLEMSIGDFSERLLASAIHFLMLRGSPFMRFYMLYAGPGDSVAENYREVSIRLTVYQNITLSGCPTIARLECLYTQCQYDISG